MTAPTVICPICDNIANLKEKDFPGYMEPHRFTIYHCPNCDTAFSLPPGNTSLIYETIYKNADRVPGYNRYTVYARSVEKSRDPLRFLADSSVAYWAVREALPKQETNSKAKVLEVGSGLGYLTFSLYRAGYEATGVDISATAVSKARKRFGDHFIHTGIKEYADVHPAEFDYIISTEVIEHIDDPVDFLRHSMKLLKPGGKLIMTTPNKSFYPKDLTWASDLPPVHRWWFSEDSVSHMAGKLNAHVSFVDFSRFYKDNYKTIGLKPNRNPFFNEAGNIIVKSSNPDNSFKVLLRDFLSVITFGDHVWRFFKKYVKLITGHMRKLIDKNIVVCGKRGDMLCAVIQRDAS